MNTKIRNIIMIGSGNLATQLALAFQEAGLNMVQVFSRNFRNAGELALRLNTKASNRWAELDQNADLYVIAVSDKSIGQVAENFPFKNKILVHPSGSESIDILQENDNFTGVFYPLNTFTKKRKVDFKNTPICIEAREKETKASLLELATRISEDVREIDSRQRLIIHTAAVFASNFVNHMYSISASLLEKHDISIDIMKPIIQEVAHKMMDHHPETAQTGPALREDHETLKKHLEVLKEFPEYRDLYQRISNHIMNQYKSKK